MKLKKKKFLETEFGGELECMITTWNQALEKHNRINEDKEVLKTLAWCQAQWEVYRMAIKHFYGVEYHFTRTDEYYGLCTEDEIDWLMKVDRGLKNCNKPASDNGVDIDSVVDKANRRINEEIEKITYHASAEDVKEAMKREALRQAVMETMEVMLNSDLFTDAAQRCKEDYHFLVLHNVITMADSIAGRYERILNEVRD